VKKRRGKSKKRKIEQSKGKAKKKRKESFKNTNKKDQNASDKPFINQPLHPVSVGPGARRARSQDLEGSKVCPTINNLGSASEPCTYPVTMTPWRPPIPLAPASVSINNNAHLSHIHTPIDLVSVICS
jgi:hypothetical protein